MSESFPTLFSPLQLRHKTLKNRIVFGAHTANMSHEGIPGPRHFGYYRERARGGAAMIVIEPSPAHRTGILTRGNFLQKATRSSRISARSPMSVTPWHGDDPPDLSRGRAWRSGQ